jgi:hypothetical protein
MLAVAQASTLDRYTNNFSLFFLLEEFRPSSYPARLGVHTHAFFEIEGDEIGIDLEVRLLVLRGAETVFASDTVAMKPGGERHRVRIGGLALPEPGSYRVVVEWRRADPSAGWIREAAAWPIKANVPLQ